MEITLRSKFDVGDMVTYVYEDKYSSTGTSRDTGPVVEVKYHEGRGWIYWIQGPDGVRWGGCRERELSLASQTATTGTGDA